MPEIITRADAKVRGLKRYYTGEPCCHGHIGERKVSSCQCCQCQLDSQKTPKGRAYNLKKQQKYQAKNHEAIRAREREKYANNPTKYRKKCKRYAEKHKDELKEKQRKRYYADIEESRAKTRRQSSQWYWNNLEYARALTRRWRSEHAEQINDRYRNGPSNPKGELQWLRKNQAQLRSVKRLLRSLSHGLPQSPSSASMTLTGSRK